MEAAAGEFNLGDDESEEGGGGGKKKLIFILLGILLLGGGGAGVYFSGILGDDTKESEQAAAAPMPKPAETIFFDLPDMLVNIDSAGARPSFLKIRASLELPADTDKIKVKALSPRIMDKFQTYLRELRLDDLKGGAGFDLLREEIRIRVNAVIHPIEVREVLFRDLLIQ